METEPSPMDAAWPGTGKASRQCSTCVYGEIVMGSRVVCHLTPESAARRSFADTLPATSWCGSYEAASIGVVVKRIKRSYRDAMKELDEERAKRKQLERTVAQAEKIAVTIAAREATDG